MSVLELEVWNPFMADPKRIGIAIVEQAGRFLVGTRGIGQDLAGHAEFPGGKCLPDEPSEVCAARECLEETGLAVVPVRQLQRVEFSYPHAVVDLHFWLCRPESVGEVPQNGFRWVERSELAQLPFPAANAEVVQELLREPRSS